MKVIKIGEEEFKLEYSFEAAECSSVVQRMFNALSMSYVSRHLDLDGNNDKLEVAAAMIDGTSEFVSDLPHICKDAFYAGLLENHSINREEAKVLMKNYMKENKLSFKKLFEIIKEVMEDDGFFELTGLTEMIAEMNQEETEEATEPEKPKKAPKVPQDHKKSTSTK